MNASSPDRPILSLCMIVRDNARTIVACLESARQWVDEIIVVDTGSLDETPQLCRQLGAKVYFFPWIDDFAAARNESLKYATGKWIFWMDSDDTMPAECGRKLRELARGQHAENVLGYVMQVHCPSPETESGDMTIVDHVKLFRNLPELRFEGRIHEQIIPSIRRLDGEIGWTDIYVVHSGYDHAPAAKQRKYERDLHHLRRELQDRPDHPFALFNMGMTLNDMEQHEQAVSHLRRCLEVSAATESHVRKAYALLIDSLAELQQFDQAETILAQGLRYYPRDPELRFRQGRLAGSQRRPLEAVAAYRQALRNDDQRHYSSIDPGIYGYKARHNLALAYQELGRHDLAEVQWRRVTELAPRFRMAWRSLHGALSVRHMTNVESLELDRLLAQPETRADGFVARAQRAQREGDLQQARMDFENALRLRRDDSATLEAWSHFLFDQGTPDEAEVALRNLIETAPDDASAWHNLGIVLIRQGNLASAAEALARSLELRPADEATRVDLQAVRHALAQSSQATRSSR